MTPPVILSIAGSDSSAGAGIQADLKTIAALRGYGTTAITAITAQNTLGVREVFPLSAAAVAAQIRAVLEDMPVAAVKLGMLVNSTIVSCVADCLSSTRLPIVCDPVMLSTSGKRLLDETALTSLRERLFPLCTLITPNLDEAAFLSGSPLGTPKAIECAAQTLSTTFGCAVLIKGGHLLSTATTDLLYTTDGITHNYPAQKINTNNLHGTGCTLSSAIATALAHGESLPQAVQTAKTYITEAIRKSQHWHLGAGNGPLSHF